MSPESDDNSRNSKGFGMYPNAAEARDQLLAYVVVRAYDNRRDVIRPDAEIPGGLRTHMGSSIVTVTLLAAHTSIRARHADGATFRRQWRASNQSTED
jgi:hypothetical protein